MILQSEMLFFGFYKNQIMCCAKPLPDPLPPLYTVTKPCPPPHLSYMKAPSLLYMLWLEFVYIHYNLLNVSKQQKLQY